LICVLTKSLAVLLSVSIKRRCVYVMQIVQEYERAVIFRLGRIAAGGAKGPGI